MNIIDARVRLPQELRPSPTYAAPSLQTEQYDKVLQLTDKMNTGRLADLLQVMDAEGIGRAVMHAESEGANRPTRSTRHCARSWPGIPTGSRASDVSTSPVPGRPVSPGRRPRSPASVCSGSRSSPRSSGSTSTIAASTRCTHVPRSSA